MDSSTDETIGCVPGPKNQIIRIQDAMGKPWPAGPMKLADTLSAAAAEAAPTPA